MRRASCNAFGCEGGVKKFGSEKQLSPDKTLFTIGEISKAVGVTRRIILNYEAKGLIVPDKKEEPCGKYRGGRFQRTENYGAQPLPYGRLCGFGAGRFKTDGICKNHGSETVGVCRYIYLEGPPQHKDKSRFVTQVVLLLKNS